MRLAYFSSALCARPRVQRDEEEPLYVFTTPLSMLYPITLVQYSRRRVHDDLSISWTATVRWSDEALGSWIPA